MKFAEESLENFAALLASNSPVPGGGGAAAMAGALGVALCSMAGTFTVGKKKYADVEDDIKNILKKAEILRKNLLALVDEDAKNFEPLSRAYAIPKNDPARAEIMEEALLKACEVPMKIIKNCAEAVDLLEEMFSKGSRLLLSDVGSGALLCGAAMESALMNIFINTALMSDEEKAGAIAAEADEIALLSYGKVCGISANVFALICG